MTVRVNTNTLAALDMVAAELRVKTGKAVTLSEAIWALIEQAAPHVAQRVEELASSTNDNAEKNLRT